MRTTIFIRILLATLLPLVIIFSLVIFTINNIIYVNDSKAVKENASLAAAYTSSQLYEKISKMDAELELLSSALSLLDYHAPDTKQHIEQLAARLLASDSTFYAVWFAFEPDAFNGNSRFYKLFMQRNGMVKDILSFTPDDVQALENAPWYRKPMESGKSFTDLLTNFDYKLGEGPITCGSVSYPVISNGRPIGVMGLDIRYEDIFMPTGLMENPRQRVLLITEDGLIIYSKNPEEVGRRLANFTFKYNPHVLAALNSSSSFQGEIISPFSGEQAMVAIHNIALRNLPENIFFYTDIATEELYRASRSSMHLIISTSILGLLLLAFSIFCATRNIVRSIKKLTADFNRVANGDLDLDFSAETGIYNTSKVRELDILQASLFKMLEQISLTHELSLKATTAWVEKERVMASAEAKSRFFANMSHEIRTPMNAILGITEILLHDSSKFTPQHLKYIEDIKISSESLLTIINDVLDLSKLESGKMQLMPVNFNFLAMLDNIKSLATYLAGNKQLEFGMSTEGDIPECLFADDVRLRQILLNVISNAVKFTRKGGIRLHVTVRKNTVVFEVTDTGIGMKPEDMKNIFEPFNQLEPTRNRAIKGTGLGLSICKNLLEIMNGKIEVESAYGTGSTFIITIPKKVGDSSALSVQNGNSYAKYSTVSALLVDDNEINLSVAKGLLKTLHGMESDLASSGPEAIEMVRHKDYDLIFMDHMMPEMDGVEATTRIRALGEKYAGIPIIALTANAVIGTKEMLVAAGLNDFLAKPIRKHELAEILYKWVPENKRDACAMPLDLQDAPPRVPAGFLLNLANMHEINVTAGLDAVAGQQDVYRQSLWLLYNKIPDVTEKIDLLLNTGKIRDYMIQVHGMKGSLAGTGLMGLSNLALNLEKAASSNDLAYCFEATPIFIQRLQSLHEQMGVLFETEKNSAGKNGDPKELAEEIAQLSKALASCDYESITASIEKLLNKDYGDDVNMMLARAKTAIDAFDYEKAAKLIANNNGA